MNLLINPVLWTIGLVIPGVYITNCLIKADFGQTLKNNVSQFHINQTTLSLQQLTGVDFRKLV